ncbi:hypothetical protein TIFTF001_034077 [Ficus carica]|uniref:Uncharacterized protein n=1 Tax=Ficus carica TaxID=3494 RepID=A0AA88JA78_FICCA|nr:hypothetical protein TIFTF001_034077 [Ficus carica]
MPGQKNFIWTGRSGKLGPDRTGLTRADHWAPPDILPQVDLVVVVAATMPRDGSRYGEIERERCRNQRHFLPWSRCYFAGRSSGGQGSQDRNRNSHCHGKPLWRFPRSGLGDCQRRGCDRSTPAFAVGDDTNVIVAGKDDAARKSKIFLVNQFSRKSWILMKISCCRSSGVREKRGRSRVSDVGDLVGGGDLLGSHCPISWSSVGLADDDGG